jgi:hypothetical protein
VRDHVEQDSINVEKYVKVLASLLVDTIQTTGKMFEEEHLRMINMVSAINTGGSGGAGNRFTATRIMEHKVIMNFRIDFKLAPLNKINALRTIMTGKAKEHFDLWETDHDPTNAAKTYEDLLNKVKDYARRRKLNSSAKEKIQQGGDPMDVGAVGGWDYEDYDYDQDVVYAIGFKGKGKGSKGGKVKRECYNGGSTGRFS